MKKKLITLCLVTISALVFSQVGINTADPKATFDIAGKPTTNIPDGVIAPRLTGDELQAKDALYDIEQTGTLVFVTAPVTTTTPKTINVTIKGYYYFDGSVWLRFEAQGVGSPFAKVVVAGNAITTFVVPATAQFTAFNFNTPINDGGWNNASNTYTVPNTGFYSFSLIASMQPQSNANNSAFTWSLRVNGQDAFTYGTVNNSGAYWIKRGGEITLYLNQSDTVQLGGFSCAGCTAGSYAVTDRTMSITYLGN